MTPLERQAIIRTGPWILYDANCGLCSRGAVRLGPITQRRGFRLAPLQSPIGREFDTGIDEMQLITRRGTVLGGVDAYAHLCRHIWWATPFTLLYYIPGIRQLLKFLYRKLAANRYRIAGMCKYQRRAEENPYALEL